MTPYSYREILQEWDIARANGEQRSLSEYSKHLNKIYKTDAFSEGLRDGWWTRFSQRADQKVFEPFAQTIGLDSLVGGVAETVGGLVGGDVEKWREEGEAIGTSLPRSVAHMAAMGIPFVGPLAYGALEGSKAFADTGDSVTAAIVGAGATALPVFGAIGARIGGKLMGGQVLRRTLTDRAVQAVPGLSRLYGELVAPTTSSIAKFEAAKYLGSQIVGNASAVPFEILRQRRENSLNGDPDAPIDWGRFARETAISAIPFSVVDGIQIARTPKVAMDRLSKHYKPAEKKPEYRSNTQRDLEETQLSAIDHYNKVKSNPNLTQEEYDLLTKTFITTLFDPESTLDFKQQYTRDANDLMQRAAVDAHIPKADEIETTVGNLDRPTLETVRSEFEGLGIQLGDDVDFNLVVRDTENILAQRREAATQAETAKNLANVKPTTPIEVAQFLDPNSPSDRALIVRLTDQGLSPDEISQYAQFTKTSSDLAMADAVTRSTTEEAKTVVEGIGKKVDPTKEATHVKKTRQGQNKNWGVGRNAAYSDNYGRRYYFATESDALAKADELNRERAASGLPEYGIRTYKDPKTGESKFYLRPKVDKVSSTKDGTNIIDIVEDTSTTSPDDLIVQREAETIAEQNDSMDMILRNVDAAKSAPKEMAKQLGVDIPDAIHLVNRVSKVLEAMKQGHRDFESISRYLEENGQDAFLSERAQNTAIAEVVTHATAIQKRQHSGFSLGSSLDVDFELVERIGLLDLDRPLSRWADWFENNIESGFYDKMLRAVRNFVDLDSIELTIDEGAGTFYQRATEDRPARINLNSLPADMYDAEVMSLRLIHEIVHHTTVEFASRTDAAAVAFRNDVRDLMEAIKKTLPPEILSAISRGQEALARVERGELSPQRFRKMFDKEFSKASDFELFYAMLNESEFISQAFSSPSVTKFLSQRSLTRKGITKRVLDFFSEIWSKYFTSGKPTENSMLAQLLGSYSNYLNSRDADGITARDFIKDQVLQGGTKYDAIASRIEGVADLFETGNLVGAFNRFAKEVEGGASENFQGLRDALVGEAAPSDVNNATMNLLMGDVPLARLAWVRLDGDLRIAKSLMRNIDEGVLPGEVNPTFRENIKSMETKLKALENSLVKQQNAILRMQDLTLAFDPNGIENLLAAQVQGHKVFGPADPASTQAEAQEALAVKSFAPADARAEASRERLEGGGMGFFARTFGLTQFTKKQFPVIAPAIDGIRYQFARSIERANMLELVHSKVPGSSGFDIKIAKSNRRVLDNDNLQKIGSSISRIIQKKFGGAKVDWNDKDVSGILNQIKDPKDRDAIMTLIESERARNEYNTNVIMPEYFKETGILEASLAIVARENGILPAQARELASQVYETARVMTDPTRAAELPAMLQNLASRLDPQTIQHALSTAYDNVQKANGIIAEMRKKPYYANEQRFDAHTVIMTTPAGKPWRASYKSESEARETVRRLEAQGYKFQDYIPKSDKEGDFYAVTPEVLQLLQDADAQAAQRLERALADKPELLEHILPATQRADMLQSALQAFKPLPNISRRFVDGREEINMFENQNEYYRRQNGWMRNNLLRLQTALELAHPELRADRQLSKYVKDHLANVTSQDSQFMTKFNQFTYNWRLAYSFGNSMLESVQSLTTGMQSLIAESGSVGDSFDMVTKATKDIATHFKTGKWANADQQWLMERAEMMGIAGMMQYSDFVDPDRSSAFEINRLGKPGKVLSKGISKIEYGARKMSTFFQRYNDRIGLLAGFELGLSRGMTREEAFNFAWDVKERGTYNGGKPQRAVGLFNIKTKAVPQMLSSLQTYAFGWFNQMLTDMKRGWGTPPPGMSKAQRAAARKAAIYGLLAQAALAGGLGMPGIGQGMALFKQATGIDLKGELREYLAEAFNEDEEAGGLLTQLALRGFAGAFTPIDPSNRANLSIPLLPVDPYQGFKMDMILGAPGSTVSDLVQGIIGTMSGDTQQMMKLLPSVMKGPVQLLTGEGDIRTGDGRLLYELSPSERLFTAMGLPPSRIQKARDVDAAQRNIIKQTAEQRSKRYAEMATMLRHGRIGDARLALLELVQENPDLDINRIRAGIEAAYEGQLHALDTRRMAGPGMNMGLGFQSRGTEVARRQSRMQASAMLGFSPRTSDLRGLSEASRIDSVIDANPFLSLAEARASVQLRSPTASRTSRQRLPAYLQGL